MKTLSLNNCPSYDLQIFLGGFDLSKEVLQVSVCQTDAKLQTVKVGGLKKIYSSAHHAPNVGGIGLSSV